GRLEVKQGDTVLKAHDISVKVWDIYYSEKTECITMYCCGYERNDFGAGGPGPDSAPDMTVGTLGSLAWERRRQYYDFLLENRLSPIVVPLEGELLHEDFEAVKKYMNNPRFTAVQLNDHSNLEAQIEVAKENGWYDKLLFSLGDEPDSLSQINAMKKRAFVLTERTGITRFNASFGIAGGPGELWMIPEEGPNVVELMSEYTTFFTINAADVTDGPIKDSLLKLKFERGDTVLWYVCGPQGNRTDLINHLTCTPGTEKRILFWQQYQNDIDGFLGFQTTRWNTYEDPWAEDYEERKFRPPIPTLEPPTGDGIVVFWHPETGAPLGSLTLEANRDGIEDFQLLRMAEQLLGKEVAMAYAERITTANNVYTKDASLLAEVRQELGDALEAALAS
ncbi:MAG: DUF4091 domain-containing protein, partial [Clostridia bacterium]|nr:DUF4091 domain-containing protein [Clostridia bacterium]